MSDNGQKPFSVIRNRKGITKEDLLIKYNTTATTYDQDLESINYNGHTIAARKACELFPMESRGGVTILDVGAGTGLLGEKLKENGFAHLDAVDPSENMLAEAKRKHIYEHYFIEYMTDKPLSIEQGTYDVVIGSGIFAYSVVPYTAIHEMIRLTKPGGYVVLANRKEIIGYKEYEHLESPMETLVTEGKWKRICRTTCPNYVANIDGLLYVYQIL